MTPFAGAVAICLGLLTACSSTHDRGVEGEGVGSAASAPDVNPEGVPYPSDNIGTGVRSRTKPGNRIANFKFLGYPNGDPSQSLQPISLAQFYDPSGQRFQLIHLQAAGVWCTACQAETKTVVPLASKLAEKKVVWLVSLAEGPTPNLPSRQNDLDTWIARYKSPFTHFLDPNNANLGPFYDRSALPWNANIDARTMEILTSGTGAAITQQAILDEIDAAFKLADESKLAQ